MDGCVYGVCLCPGAITTLGSTAAAAPPDGCGGWVQCVLKDWRASPDAAGAWELHGHVWDTCATAPPSTARACLRLRTQSYYRAASDACGPG
ncbi:hypothetical protein BO71DRAFT_404180 [Aspergillus ellipticus CBS 707.79]|uniref:Uncharacterized protein n=1 Tax=Aspergillus ellipticus CBS 707.79 TaxID=1448320 RepID=A0A319EA92_9EURO|nr:hypothetical protein BO71DRAFT_404180 [Aspergillus ellipticus CBS 707.79]